MKNRISYTNYIVGHSHGFHDAACSIIDIHGNVLFAEHTERVSGIKTDSEKYPIPKEYNFDNNITAFYENPFIRQLRQWFSGEKIRPKSNGYDHYISHHWAHAASSYYTRPWEEEPVCVVIDAIGEFDTASIWYNKKKIWSMKYPCSIGLFYSAITKYLKLRPNRDEHLTMALAGMSDFDDRLLKIFHENVHTNFHKGIDFKILQNYSDTVIASTAQKYLEDCVLDIMSMARKYSRYLCYSGGVALNCVANTKIHNMFEDSWIFPNPGDAGASFGAALAVLDKKITFNHNFLGTNIVKNINPKEVANHLLDHGICGIANGRGEFGPRALGNRSLICDPRKTVAEKIYSIKERNRWSPLAPVILSEYFTNYFDGPMNKYMSYVCNVKELDNDLRMIRHTDNSARVQVLYPDSPTILRQILEEWYNLTKCPILINTSLNYKGMPVVNNQTQAQAYGKSHGIKIF